MNVDFHSRGFEPCATVSLCTGGGGLDLGLELALPGYRPVAYVERDAFACSHLVAAMRQGLMASAPLWSDARTFPGRKFRGRVDCVVGGIPCQPHSVAGKRLGRGDERDLWSSFRRILVQTGAWCCLIENVPGMVTSGGLERVWRDLQRLGFEVEGGLVSAQEVGASHGRERLFVLGVHRAALAHGNRERLQGQRTEPDAQGREDARRQARLCDGAVLVDAARQRRGQGRAEPEIQRGRSAAACDGEPVADTGRGEGGQRHELDGIGRWQGEAEQAGMGGGVMGLAHGARWQAAGPGYLLDAGREPVEGCGLVADDPRGGSGAISVQPRRQEQAGADADGRRDGMVNALGGGCDGRADESIRQALGRGADEAAGLDADGRSGDWPLFAPGPADRLWGTVADVDPLRLPALSRHDLFRDAVRTAGVDPHGDPVGTGGRAPGLHAAQLQAAAQSTLRGLADGLAAPLDANRIDQLRMLGNGVVPLAAAHAVRSLSVALGRRHGVDPARFVWGLIDG